MDFHTMVSSFKRRVLEEEQEIKELSKKARGRVQKYIDDGTPERHTPRYSFNHIFGDEDTMRVAIPLAGGVRLGGAKMFKRLVLETGYQPAFTLKTVTQKRQRLAADGGGEYEEQVEIPNLQMKKEVKYTIPKGPRAGETITQTKTTSLGKLVASEGTPEEKAWWRENQNDLREMTNVQDYFLKPWINNFRDVVETPPMVIVSRHPIDVARMSDFSMTRSCHSEGSSHFDCAIQESRGHGMVAYVITGEDYEYWEIEERLNAEEEIFKDTAIALDGPEPTSRVRLYKLFNQETGEEFAVVEDRVYGVKLPDFLPTVRKWARESQKSEWADAEGNIKDSFLDGYEWIRVGGEYADQVEKGGAVGDLVSAMFEDTPMYEDAADRFDGHSFEHEDYYSEGQANLEEEAERELEELQGYADDATKHGGFYLQMEEGWDGMPFYIDAGYSVEFTFELPEGWDDEPEAHIVPSWRDTHQEQRHFELALTDATDDVYIGEEEWDYNDSDNEEIVVRLNIRATEIPTGLDGVEAAKDFVEEALRDVEAEYESIKAKLRINLINAGYLPPTYWNKAVADLDTLELENIDVFFNEDDPSEGASIESKPSGISIGSYDSTTSKSGVNITGAFIENLIKRRQTIASELRRRMKRALRQVQRHAAKQMSLPYPSGPRPTDKMPKVPYELEAKLVRLNSPDLRDWRGRQLSGGDRKKIMDQTKIELGVKFKIELPYDVEEEEYLMAKEFIIYLDKNIDLLTDAAKAVADEEWRQTVADTDNIPKNISGVVDLGSGPGLDESRLREVIRRAIKKSMLKEQTGFETRLFQVNLRLSIDREAGGGIEQKLTRIRAIQGVAVVSHEEGSSIGGRRTIEAKVKFHPERDALQPATYISQILVPEINSSSLVPGVKVLDVIKGTIKRLDK
tara:strand:+ start:7867 stop:10596 length:2730 start_codon:yes stop_codon:yes gene_type:complete